jgi:hypothetical protein
MDASKRPSLILKPCEAYQAYREMLRFYGTKNLTAYLETEGSWDVESLPGLHSSDQGNGSIWGDSSSPSRL